MKDPQRLVRRSVLDRLVQSEAGEPRSWTESVQVAKRAVLRDVEWLLNTRRIADPAPATLQELQRSVYHYGIPDVTSISADSMYARRELLRQVEDCIALFEPRLSHVRVSEPTAEGSAARHVRFVVEAVLKLESETEPIVFDTMLEPTSGRFSVTGAA